MKHSLVKSLISLFWLVLFGYMVLPSLNPLDQRMFDFHDMTQPGRVTEFTTLLKQGHFPPRMAPELSNNLGFPIFSYYTPGAYWITSGLNLLGLPVVMALKTSFLLGIVLAGLGMFWYLKEVFDDWAGYLGATIYVTATYFATEIVIRGNLGEVWFLALLPWAFYLVKRLSKKVSASFFLGLVLVLSGLFTVHNIFSLLAFPLVLVFILISRPTRWHFVAYGLAAGMSVYFWLPMLGEMHLTQAVRIAQGTRYQDHFLCLNQFWSSNGWLFGGSIPGCDDAMSFKVGKIPFVLYVTGFITALLGISYAWRKWTKHLEPLLMTLIFAGSIFLTLPASAWIWSNFGLATFQFPWRFMILVMFAGSYLGAYFIYRSPKLLRPVLVLPIIVASFLVGHKYYVKPMHTLEDYTAQYNTRSYRVKTLAYLMPEYLNREADFVYWQRFDTRRIESDKLTMNIKRPYLSKQPIELIQNEWFKKSFQIKNPGKVVLNIHYFPVWKITHNNQPIIPTKFDRLGRPVLQLGNGEVRIEYQQTPLQKLANGLTIVSALVAIGILIKKPWKSAS